MRQPLGKQVAVAEGFTLIEIMAALAILGTTLIVLLDSHYKALQLHDETREAMVMDMLVERAMNQAELDVQAGNEEGSGDFGDGYSDYAYSYTATLLENQWETEGVTLYDVAVTVTGLEEEPRTFNMLVYYMGVQ